MKLFLPYRKNLLVCLYRGPVVCEEGGRCSNSRERQDDSKTKTGLGQSVTTDDGETYSTRDEQLTEELLLKKEKMTPYSQGRAAAAACQWDFNYPSMSDSRAISVSGTKCTRALALIG